MFFIFLLLRGFVQAEVAQNLARDLSPFFFLHVTPHGLRVESVKFRGKYLFVKRGGDVVLKTPDATTMSLYELLRNFVFLAAHYDQCQQLRHNATTPPATTTQSPVSTTAAPTIGGHEASLLADLLSQAGAQNVQPNSDVIRDHVRVTQASPTTQAPTQPLPTLAPVPLSDTEQSDLLAVLSAAGLDLTGK